MALSTLKSETIRQNAELQSIEDGGAVAVTLLGNGRASILLACHAGRPGDVVTLIQSSMAKGLSLEAIERGRAATEERPAVPATRRGDVVVFAGAARRGEDLVVGSLATRVHNHHQGMVQIARCLARPTRIKCDAKKGPTQYLEIIDPASAARVTTREEFVAQVRKAFGAPWPGGEPGFLLRDGTTAIIVRNDRNGPRLETADEFGHRMLDTNKVLDAGPVEMIPFWALPMGREQMVRETIDLRSTVRAMFGSFGRRYVAEGEAGFRPSLVILCDEQDRSFGNQGPVRRVAAGLEPIHPAITTPATVVTAFSQRGAAPVTAFRVLHTEDRALIEAMKARQAAAQASGSRASAGPAPGQASVPAGLQRLARLPLLRPAGPVMR